MPNVQVLKKQLRGISSTQKLTKAMKTVSTVKFSKLNEIYNGYSEYGKQCRETLMRFGGDIAEKMPMGDETAPVLYIVISSNKGLCGNFNSQLLGFAFDEISKDENCLLAVCGKKADAYFKNKGKRIEKYFAIEDVPSFEDSCRMLDEIIGWRVGGKVSAVKVIYPEYINMLNQRPCITELFSNDYYTTSQNVDFVPDKKTFSERVAQRIFHAIFYQILLETAIGAQASTLMTMRSAYDTATEYRQELERQINRMRQSAVTADVIETSAERSN